MLTKKKIFSYSYTDVNPEKGNVYNNKNVWRIYRFSLELNLLNITSSNNAIVKI